MIWELRLQRGLVSMAAWPQVLEDPWQRGGAGRDQQNASGALHLNAESKGASWRRQVGYHRG